MNTTGSPSVDELLSRVAPHFVTLPFMSMERQSRFVEFIRIYPFCFDGDMRLYAYIFLFP